MDIQGYYNRKSQGKGKDQKKLSPATLEQHHTVIHGMLKAAESFGYVAKNAAKQVPVKPHVKNKYQDVLQHTWTPEEANQFLKTVKEKADPQQLAFYALALDTGARKAELCGLQWKDVDLEQGTVFIHQQLKRPSPSPEFSRQKTAGHD